MKDRLFPHRRALMKKKTYLCIAMLCVFGFMIQGQATKVISPVQRSNVTVIAPLKIIISDQCEWGGIHNLTVALSRSGQPVSGAKVTCGSKPLSQQQPGSYSGSIAFPVAVGQAIVITVVDPLLVTRTATATIHNTVRIVRPANQEVIDRAQVSAIPVKWVFAAGSAPVYFLVNSSQGGGGYVYSKDGVAAGQFFFPLGGVPAGTPVAPGSQGFLLQYDTVHVSLK
jgi:hypothetical protein